MALHRTSVAPLVESDAVFGWRRARLLAAGCPPDLAARLAADCEIELCAVLDLLDRGCTPELADRIVAPLGKDRRPC